MNPSPSPRECRLTGAQARDPAEGNNQRRAVSSDVIEHCPAISVATALMPRYGATTTAASSPSNSMNGGALRHTRPVPLDDFDPRFQPTLLQRVCQGSGADNL